jgi:hypothetical protein
MRVWISWYKSVNWTDEKNGAALYHQVPLPQRDIAQDNPHGII